jgi:hypothetical protein
MWGSSIGKPVARDSVDRNFNIFCHLAIHRCPARAHCPLIRMHCAVDIGKIMSLDAILVS